MGVALIGLGTQRTGLGMKKKKKLETTLVSSH